MGGQEGGLRVGFAFGGEAEGDGHDFCFAEEESGILVRLAASFEGEERSLEREEKEEGRFTCYRIIASVRL